MARATMYTNRYQLAHGKRPSGYGMWAFQILGEDGAHGTADADSARAEELGIRIDYQGIDGTAIAWVSSRTYGEAARAIKRLATDSFPHATTIDIEVLT
jgi:hypothetical protein